MNHPTLISLNSGFFSGFKRVRTKTFGSRDGVSPQYVVFSFNCLLLFLNGKVCFTGKGKC